MILDICGDTVIIHSKAMSYVITREKEYICINIDKYINCVTLNHRDGTIRQETYMITRSRNITKRRSRIYRTNNKKGRKILRDFEILAETILDNASLTHTLQH